LVLQIGISVFEVYLAGCVATVSAGTRNTHTGISKFIQTTGSDSVICLAQEGCKLRITHQLTVGAGVIFSVKFADDVTDPFILCYCANLFHRVMLWNTPVFQISDIATGIIEPTTQQFSNFSPRFCPFSGFGVAGILPAHFEYQIPHTSLIFKQAEETRVNSLESLL
jgi:hypothetical protein